jgi:hypothetical protein
MPAPRLRPPVLAALAALSLLGGCRAVGGFLQEALRERPPAPLDSLTVASDARIDSLGRLVGSFVGEGTGREVHLLSSDTALIAALAHRFRPDLAAESDEEPLTLWHELARRGVVALGEDGRRRTVAGKSPGTHLAIVGSPLGHTAVTIDAVLLRGGRSRCRGRGAQAEILVRDDRAPGDPPLRGPVLGSLLGEDRADRRERGMMRRPDLPQPSDSLVHQLIDRTGLAMDSTLAADYPWLALRPLHGSRIEVNSLADVDAADVVPFRAASATVRYAVSLRERRGTPRRDTLVVTTVMVWDSAGAWRQVIFRPTVLLLAQGYPQPYGGFRPALFWRRLQPISDFAFRRDNLWLEQVDTRDGSIRWGIVQPRGNVVVAAAEVEGPCR